MSKTKIEWATDVWNPLVGCTKVSAGCKNCYAERMFKRFNPDKKFTDVHCYPERLNQPLHWKKPRRVFVDSMSDLFHEDVPFDFILRVWMTMSEAKQHIFIVLTKRPERMNIFINEWLPGAWGLATMSLKLLDIPLPNVWLGVSVEDQKTADKRIHWLLGTPAAVRGLSCEPMLGEIELETPEITIDELMHGRHIRRYLRAAVTGKRRLDWVICGCESGPGARPMELDWARSLRDQCQAANVPFFLKQAMINGKLVKMPELDGKVWDERPGKG